MSHKRSGILPHIGIEMRKTDFKHPPNWVYWVAVCEECGWESWGGKLESAKAARRRHVQSIMREPRP